LVNRPSSSSARISSRICSHRSRPTQAGFTLIELMVVVVIVSILCVLAIPTLSHEGYERRAFTDAANIGELVRQARTRAVARGLAEMVIMRANSTGNSASFMLYEAYTSTAAYASCGAPSVWPGGSGTVTATLIDGFQISPTGSGTAQSLEALGNVNIRINNPATSADISAANNLYLCFTPAGRTWYAVAATPPTSYAALGSATGAGSIPAVTIDVVAGTFPSTTTGGTSSTDLVRTVWIPPSGATRISSQ